MTKLGGRRLLAGIILALVAADWGTKLWITNRLALGETVALVDGWLYFVHRHNPGVAFSLLADLPDTFRILMLTALSLAGI
ncbi:MAG TPA: signal peptidase II, partial [Longimicrobiaceae bacterium]|nr:signal peptidase II [Longimicrobiaceae bacterium]